MLSYSYGGIGKRVQKKGRNLWYGMDFLGFGGCSPVPKNGTRVHSDVPRYQKPERRYIRMFPSTENRNEGTFAKTALL